jgi:hypothetical protein
LAKLYGHLKPDTRRIKRLPILDERLKNKTSRKQLEIGVVRTLPDPIDTPLDATTYKIAEGDVLVMGIVSEGSLYTRVQFTEMDLPVGARVFVYSIANPDEFYGPYEGHGASESGTFWTPPMKGEGVVIEYFTPTAANGIPFKVSKVSHVYTDPTNLKVGGCHNEVSDPWTDTAKSVGRLDFVSGGSVFLCTGTLVNDAVPSSDIPYVLTANHCFETQSEAQSLRVWWNYLTENDPPTESPPPGTPFTDGANLLAIGFESDFTFVRLTGTLPGGLFFSGWDAATFSGSAAGAGIHHPDGTHKRISFGNARQPTSQAECDSVIDGLQCLAVDWSSGVTEEGSSGSGLWKGLPTDPGGALLIGTLTGGPSVCGGADLRDMYGRFSVTYPHIASYLTGAGNSCSATPITVGQTVNGALDGGDCQHQHRGGSFADLYSFSGIAGQRVVISLTAVSNSFDTYLYLIGPTGAIVAENDDSNGTLNSRIPPAINDLFTLPATGTYTIEATSWDAHVTGSYTLTLSGPVGKTLTVASSNPNSGVSIEISPGDLNNQGNGVTQFTRIYDPNFTPTLTAPATAGGNVFQEWRKDNAFATSNRVVQVRMDADHTITAVYRAPNVYTLTVDSSPDSGVAVTVSPNDNGGQGNGTTQFTRTYTENANVNLTASQTLPDGKIFSRWQRNGANYTTSNLVGVQMTGTPTNITMTAVYRFKPLIYAEEGTSDAAAIDSVTFVRGPFRLFDPNNFSGNNHLRLIIFISEVGLTQVDIGIPGRVTAETPGFHWGVDNAGPLTGVLTGSYLVIRPPDFLPPGALPLTVKVDGVASDPKTVHIIP